MTPFASPADEEAFHASLPAKTVAAMAVFLDSAGSVLMVKPTYKEGWLLPGGTVEAGESPLEGCLREVTEELGLDRPLSRLLAVDYLSALPPAREAVYFAFFGGVLDQADIEAIRLPPDELSEFGFFALDDAIARASGRLGQRLATCLRAGSDHALYLHDGVPPPGWSGWSG
jgi:8-oxo-dGTP diphosphatase